MCCPISVFSILEGLHTDNHNLSTNIQTQEQDQTAQSDCFPLPTIKKNQNDIASLFKQVAGAGGGGELTCDSFLDYGHL